MKKSHFLFAVAAVAALSSPAFAQVARPADSTTGNARALIGIVQQVAVSNTADLVREASSIAAASAAPRGTVCGLGLIGENIFANPYAFPCGGEDVIQYSTQQKYNDLLARGYNVSEARSGFFGGYGYFFACPSGFRHHRYADSTYGLSGGAGNDNPIINVETYVCLKT